MLHAGVDTPLSVSEDHRHFLSSQNLLAESQPATTLIDSSSVELSPATEHYPSGHLQFGLEEPEADRQPDCISLSVEELSMV